MVNQARWGSATGLQFDQPLWHGRELTVLACTWWAANGRKECKA